MKKEHLVTACDVCPLRRQHRGQGEYWEFCTHPESPKGYDNIIPLRGEIPKFPEWCPLQKEEYEVSYRIEEEK